MQALDPSTLPLTGQQLIEASAGTGKTYTISSLYLRLILEKHLSIDEILVVTFTQAATEELRERIRQRLNLCLQAFINHKNNKPLSQEQTKDTLIGLLLSQSDDIEKDVITLDDAMKRMDEVCVFTIHGFCQRTLQDNAFESGVLFDTEFLTEENTLITAIIEDYWRQHFYTASSQFIEYIHHSLKTPEGLSK